jgi:hypothetical protein
MFLIFIRRYYKGLKVRLILLQVRSLSCSVYAFLYRPVWAQRFIILNQSSVIAPNKQTSSSNLSFLRYLFIRKHHLAQRPFL